MILRVVPLTCAGACRAASNVPSEAPATPEPLVLRKSRRLITGHLRGAELNSAKVPPCTSWFARLSRPKTLRRLAGGARSQPPTPFHRRRAINPLDRKGRPPARQATELY